MRRAIWAVALAAACGKSSSSSPAPAPVDRQRVVEFLRDQPAATRAEIVAEVSAPKEQPGAIHRGDTALTLLGETLDVGDLAPDVTLTEMTEDGLGALSLGSLRGKIVVLSVVPSIDTRVCEAQTHAVSEAIPRLPPDAVVITVSRDLPFAQTRFAEEARTQTRMASDYHGGGFGEAFGLEVKETGLLARSAWIIDRDGKIAYRDLLDEQADQPDYEALVAAAAQVAGG